MSALSGFDGASYTVTASLNVSDAGSGEVSREETMVVANVRIRSGTLVSVTVLKDPGSSVVGDFNGDGSVSFGDFVLFSQAFGSRIGETVYDVLFDLDSDGQIGFSDCVRFALVYGT